MFSSQNLITNGGFARASPGAIAGWECVAPGRAGAWWQRIAVPDFNEAGLPHSSHAVQFAAHHAPGGGWLQQNVALREGLSRRFALRLVARGVIGNPECTVTVVATDAAAAGRGRVVGEWRFRVSPEWGRHRFVFELPGVSQDGMLRVQLHGPEQAQGSVCFTDVWLVCLFQPVEEIGVRFDTRKDLSRASSRLRAWMLADYLDLLGVRTSMNGGSDCDVYVCQKRHPFLKARNARRRGALVLYDLDDNDFIMSAARNWKIRRFLRMTDAVSAGSELLREKLRVVHPKAFLFDNPVDVLDRDVCRPRRPWGGRLVWFGGPENLWGLRTLRLAQPVTTITRGGDVEYDVKRVDGQLTGFDLALLPVALTEETAAKNANRLVKCVGLGLPFLASDTPEHRRALGLIGLPDSFLAREGEDWSERIALAARNYARIEETVLQARPRLFEVYGIEAAASKWLQWCVGLLRENRASRRR